MLYVLYEVLGGTPVSALQSDHPTADKLGEWLRPYRELPHKVLATLSDGEDTIVVAMKACWPESPHQRCPEHVLANIAESALKCDAQLRQSIRQDLGGLPAVPEQVNPLNEPASHKPVAGPTLPIDPVGPIPSGPPLSVEPAESIPPFCLASGTPN